MGDSRDDQKKTADGKERQAVGPQVLDARAAGNWDEAQATMGPGQASTPGDPHYRDLYPMWLDNESFPLSFSAGQVARVAESRLTLRPQSP